MLRKARAEELINAGEPYEVDSTLEMRPKNGNSRRWEMSLRRNGIMCYRKYGERDHGGYVDYTNRVLPDRNKDELKNCNKYVINKYSNEKKYSNENKYCNENKYSNEKKLYTCSQLCETNWKSCNFYVCKKYCIKETKEYYAAARSTAERVITICPRAHENNERWVEVIQISQDRKMSTAVHLSLFSIAVFEHFHTNRRCLEGCL